jgi:RNA polymerase sigma factor (sigma-70 family)
MTDSPLMDEGSIQQHLSQISTAWTAVIAAHHGPADAAAEAQKLLVKRYQAAIYSYLLGAVRSSDVADELFQEFALRLVRGDFKAADPRRGRFRSFLKTSLYHLIVDHQRRQQRQPLPLSADVPDQTSAPSLPDETEAAFLEAWRGDLMRRAWEALADHDRQKGQHLYTVLRFRGDHPKVRSAEMVKQISARVGRPVTAEWIHKRLFMARQKFTELLVEEVEQSLEDATPEQVAEELAEVGLLEYCKAALDRRNAKSQNED